jgi:N-acetylmuramoyl-L-alanine amidase
MITEKTAITGHWKGTVEDLLRPFANGGDIIRAKRLAPMYIKFCEKFKIRADIAFAQMCHETGLLKFTGIARPEWNNFCGLGITGPGAKQTFKTEDLGVVAHCAHLAWYVFPDHVNSMCSKNFDPRHFEAAGNHHPKYNGDVTLKRLAGSWAVPGDKYAQAIVKYANIINNFGTITDELEPISLPEPVSPIVETPANGETKFDVIVQMGHVGRIKGATGAYREKGFTQKLGNSMASLLELTKLNYRVMGADDWLPIEPNRAKIFFALHYDGSTNKDARGYSLGFKPGTDEAFKEKLAVSYGKLAIPNISHRRKDNYTQGLKLYYAWRDDLKRKPHVVADWYALLEHGFGSNEIEREWMFKNIYNIAKHHVDLIVEFLNEQGQ